MGNPCRYVFEKAAFICRPEIDEESKKLIINFYNRGEYSFRENYEKATIDFYSAPDVIMTYTNGNTCKDEFRRLARWDFDSLKLDNKEDSLDGEYTRYNYTYESVDYKWFNFDDPESKTDIPMGKFAGKTYEEVQQYKKLNKYEFAPMSWPAKMVNHGPDFHC